MPMVDIVAIASDHGGYGYKEQVKAFLAEHYADLQILDLGTNSTDSVDYPTYGHAMGEAIASGHAQRGILICGTGIGISIAANRHADVRAALCTNTDMARLTREHNDANVLALGARIIDLDTALACVRTFLDTKFEGGRHERRVEAINQ